MDSFPSSGKGTRGLWESPAMFLSSSTYFTNFYDCPFPWSHLEEKIVGKFVVKLKDGQESHFHSRAVCTNCVFFRGCVGAHASVPFSVPVHVHVHVLLPCVSLPYYMYQLMSPSLSSLHQCTRAQACLAKIRACARLQDHFCIHAPAGHLLPSFQSTS